MIVEIGQDGREGCCSKGHLINGFCGAQRFQILLNLPAVAAAETMRDRQKFALLRIHVIVAMGIARKEHSAVKRLHPIDDVGDDGLRLFGTLSAIDKIILHIDHN